MGRKHFCKICNDATAAPAINAMIESHVRQAIIHTEHPEFSISQISRHGRNCLAKPKVDSADGSEAGVWLERLRQTYDQAVIDGDTKARVSAITAASRSLEKMRKAEAEKQDDELPTDVHQWTDKQGAQFTAYIDSVVREATEKAGPDSGVGRMNWLYSLSPDALALFRKISGDPDLLMSVRNFVANQLPQRPPTEGANNAHVND
jgi:hypothetical protein